MGSGAANGGEWSRSAPPNATIIYKIGIYGWRKRCLYCFILLIMVTTIINLALTVWVLRVMDFSIDGMGKLRLTKDGVRVEGDAEFLRALYAKHIRSTANSALFLESSLNITLNARDGKDKVINKMILGDRKLRAYAKKFEVRSPAGKSLYSATQDEVLVGADRFTIAGGATFKGSVQTPLVTSDLEDLRVQAPAMNLTIDAGKQVWLNAPAGDINITTTDALRLHAKKGGIHMKAGSVSLKNLPRSPPGFTGGPYEKVWQLCICNRNGKLFLAPAMGNCQANTATCS